MAESRGDQVAREVQAFGDKVGVLGWSTRIPAAIEKGKGLLGGDEYVLIPPHTRGNDTEFTVVLTAGEVELAAAIFPYWDHGEGTDAYWDVLDAALRAYTEKIESC